MCVCILSLYSVKNITFIGFSSTYALVQIAVTLYFLIFEILI